MPEPFAGDRSAALEIWLAGVKAVHPDFLVPEIWQHLPSGDPTPILVLGGGKAGAAMARALVNSAPPWARLHGLVNVPDDQAGVVSGFGDVTLHGSRPPGGNLPTSSGVEGTTIQLRLAGSALPGTIGICMLSGGASALMPLPRPPITLDDKLETTRLLQNAGADITLLNATRKHLSAVKGGGLARAWMESPSGRLNGQLFTFAISDVVGDDPSVIASGPTVADPSTYISTWDALYNLGISAKLPTRVTRHFQEGISGIIPETPKSFPNQIHYLTLGNNRKALEAATRHADSKGFETALAPDLLEGPIEQVARRIATDIIRSPGIPGKTEVLLWGGEPTLVIPPGSGKGGRNQELALRIGGLLPIGHLKRTTILCAGTDGEDGPTDAAGGFYDFRAFETALQLGISLEQAVSSHSSHGAHAALGSLVRTGWTGTNVADIVVAVIRS